MESCEAAVDARLCVEGDDARRLEASMKVDLDMAVLSMVVVVTKDDNEMVLLPTTEALN